MKKYFYGIGLSIMMLSACGGTSSEAAQDAPAQIDLTNPTADTRPNAVVKVEAAQVAAAVPEASLTRLKFMEGDKLVPFQANDEDGDGQIDHYLLMLDFAAAETKSLSVAALAEGEELPAFPKRTQAELSHKVNGEWQGREYMEGNFRNVDYLRVPPEHTDHSWFIRYEGPGWESDLVGYRFYLDWRNATDIFGKKTTDMVLQDVGQDGFDSYHEPAAWGMDILKVGESLGLGSLAYWDGEQAQRVAKTDSVDCRIVANGTLESEIRTRYLGWQIADTKVDLTSDISIQAGSRMTKHEVSLNAALPNLCTGIVKHANTELLEKKDGEWGYLATWGTQSLAEDKLGMAIIYRTDQLVEVTADAHSEIVVLQPEANKLKYYFLAAWEQDPQPLNTKAAFEAYLDESLRRLNQPVQLNN